MQVTRLALAALIAMLALYSPSEADVVADCRQQEDTDLAIEACTVAINSDRWSGEGLAWAYNNRGLAFEAKQDYQRALVDYDRALQLAPDYAAAYSNRGNSHAYQGNLEQALADHNRAIELDPNYVEAYHNRGVDYEELGDLEAALADYRKVLELDPEHRNSHLGIATVTCKLGDVEASMEARLSAIRKRIVSPRAMQEMLRRLDYYSGTIDGVFGRNSQLALRSWTSEGCR